MCPRRQFKQKKTAPLPVPSFQRFPAAVFLLLRFFDCCCSWFLFFRFGGLGFSLLGFFLGRGRGGRRGGRGARERRAHAVLHDRDRDHLAALQLEDGHLGVLAVALGVE